MLLDDPEDEVVSEAIQVISRWRMSTALLSVKRLAESHPRGYVRVLAIGTYRRLANRDDATAMLLKILDSPDSRDRGAAATNLGVIGCRECVPRIIEMLSDPEWYARVSADGALRALAVLPDGVGFDYTNPDPALWVDWWADSGEPTGAEP